MKQIIAIVGPTASGKTSLSIQLAQKLDTQIVCMDSMQVYQRMDIGTAKPTIVERAGIAHHMLDLVPPSYPYSVAEYVEGAKQCIEKIHHMNRIPILVGGTGLYLKALTGGMPLGGTVGNEDLRHELAAIAETPGGKQRLHEELQHIDPVSAARLHMNDCRRVIRAIEVFRMTGKPISSQSTEVEDKPYDVITLGVGIERPQLIERINHRVDLMLKMGLVAEVEALLASGVSPEAQAMQGLGYKELIPYLNHQCTLQEAATQIKISTRQYAKRQMTWFKRTEGVCWLNGLDSAMATFAAKEVERRMAVLQEDKHHE
ncbi:MAG: tRNA (adenosine(37)-N6)-dimethylallyltransferase MiaA [Clostridia bacterium]|nr:tRNA (adenosine(37)-N6)-dimethylallyltransferase MiaA [Clostridia bacterium]